jgi:hypothetical protein
MALDKGEIDSALNELENYFSESPYPPKPDCLLALYALEREFEDPLQPGDKDLEKEAARTGREKKMQEARLVLARIRSAIERGEFATGLETCRDLRNVLLQIWPNLFPDPA